MLLNRILAITVSGFLFVSLHGCADVGIFVARKYMQGKSLEDIAKDAKKIGGIIAEKTETVNQQQRSYQEKNDIVMVQIKLERLGYHPGTPDGVLGPKTELAICKFQGANGLAVTGKLDIDTFNKIQEVSKISSSGSNFQEQ